MDLIDPTTYPHWNDLLLTNENASFFHTSNWAKVLHESYGYTPVYFTEINEGKIVGLVPFMEVNSFLTGRRGVSLPFTDTCSAIADSREIFEELLNSVIQYGNQAQWRHLGFCGGKDFLGETTYDREYFTHIVSLNGDEKGILESFRKSTYRNIRKAQNEHVRVSIRQTRDALKTYYRLHCMTRKHHGIPPQPWLFFENIYKHILSPNKGFVALAEYRGKSIAGAVYFLFRDWAIYKFGASDRKYQHLRANNLVMWETILWLSKNGVHHLHLGKTEPGNEGLMQFKRGWRGMEGKETNYRFVLKLNAFSPARTHIKSSYPICKILPIPILRLMGNVLYRHVA